MVKTIRYPMPSKTVDFIEMERKKFIARLGVKINKTKFVELKIHGRIVNALLNGEKNIK